MGGEKRDEKHGCAGARRDPRGDGLAVRRGIRESGNGQVGYEFVLPQRTDETPTATLR